MRNKGEERGGGPIGDDSQFATSMILVSDEFS
jgi:hypothetical protein